MDINDVLTIATSRAETKFQTELGAARKELKEAETDLAKANKTLTQAIQKQSEDLGERHAAAIREGIKAMGGKVEVEAKSALWQEKVCATVKILTGNNYSNGSFSLEEKPNAGVVSATEMRDRAQEAKTRAEETAMEWKKKLNNIPTLERRMKAKLAEAKLRDSEEGLAMLNAITDNLDKEMLALPGF